MRFRRNFKGFFNWVLLAIKTFFAADRNAVVITVARLAWPVRLKQLLGNGKLLLVLHNYDPNDGKPRLFYALLASFLRHAAKNGDKVRVVAVAPYWQRFFEDRFMVPATLFPNFFDANTLQIIGNSGRKNPKLIHFGMFSEKIDIKKYIVLYHFLKEHGFVCYFSSSVPVFCPDLPVSVFQNRSDYLKQVAGSAATIILNKVIEGWPRVAHESILLGTPVIASPGGGLEELVHLSGGIVCDNPEAIAVLLQKPLPDISFDNTPFEPSAKNGYLKTILNFIAPQA
jgi:glycosyltransferase involved in cell wall biosynthesis